MNHPGQDLTPRYARFLLRLTRPFPDFDVFFIKPLRAKAVQLLRLKPGERVLDVDCGMGGSFPFLANAVGSAGEVVGVEISPEAVVSARRRINRNRWSNVSVLQAPAQIVSLTGMYDGLIMFAAPDVYASMDALANILPHLRAGARIVLFGAKSSRGVAGSALNPLLKLAVSKLSFDTTPHPDAAPWQLVAGHVEELEIREYFFGAMFLASGSLMKGATIVPSGAASSTQSSVASKASNPSIERTSSRQLRWLPAAARVER